MPRTERRKDTAVEITTISLCLPNRIQNRQEAALKRITKHFGARGNTGSWDEGQWRQYACRDKDFVVSSFGGSMEQTNEKEELLARARLAPLIAREKGLRSYVFS